ncbi:MAG: putative sporulation protein YtxC [Bacillota bacterium]
MAFLIMEIRSEKYIDLVYGNLMEKITPLDHIKTSLVANQRILSIYQEQERETSSVSKVQTIVAETLADIIVNKWEASMIENVIENNFYYFTANEREKIGARAQEIMRGQDKERNGQSSCVPVVTRQNKIGQLLTDYLHEQKYLNIEGFINFRLPDYWQSLEEAVELAVDDYMMEKEHDEFVRLLKYFVDMQEPRVSIVNVILKASGFFQLFDNEDNVIDNKYKDGFIVDMVQSEINSEDLLISALITIAPKRINLHVPEPIKVRDIMATLQSVFGERLKVCAGCTCCRNLGENQ